VVYRPRLCALILLLILVLNIISDDPQPLSEITFIIRPVINRNYIEAIGVGHTRAERFPGRFSFQPPGAQFSVHAGGIIFSGGREKNPSYTLLYRLSCSSKNIGQNHLREFPCNEAIPVPQCQTPRRFARNDSVEDPLGGGRDYFNIPFLA